jgi:hypothetical protein
MAEKEVLPKMMMMIPESSCLNPEDRRSKFLRNVGNRSQNYTVLQLRRPHSK